MSAGQVSALPWLCGCAARHEGQPGQRPGDIDVLVLGEPGRDQFYDPLSAAEKWLGRHVQATIRGADWLDAGSGSFHDTVTSRPPLRIPLSRSSLNRERFHARQCCRRPADRPRSIRFGDRPRCWVEVLRRVTGATQLLGRPVCPDVTNFGSMRETRDGSYDQGHQAMGQWPVVYGLADDSFRSRDRRHDYRVALPVRLTPRGRWGRWPLQWT